MPKLGRALPFIGAVALVIVISVFAYSGHIPSIVSEIGADKVLHAAMGCTLTVLLARVLRGRAWLAGVLVFLPLALDEYLQRFSTTRSSDWGDLFADFAGVAIAVAFVMLRRRRSAQFGVQADCDEGSDQFHDGCVIRG